MKMAAYYELQWCVRGYHVYMDECEAAIGEELQCERERKNSKDPYAVAVTRKNVVVGHLPRKISRVSALFIKRQGKIRCKVVGRRRYSVDLPQGGLEIPCVITFEGTEKDVNNVKKPLKVYHQGASDF